MAQNAVEFERHGSRLHLIYRPSRVDAQWLRRRLQDGDSFTIKGTYHVTQADLVQGPVEDDPDELTDEDEFEVHFLLARARGEYFVFKPAMVRLDVPVLLARDAQPNWKWFSAEERVSVLRLLAELRPTRIVIGGEAADAIPIPEYVKLINQLPTPHELRLYVRARLAVVFREVSDAQVDANAQLKRYVAKRISARPPDLIRPFREAEYSKYKFLLETLRQMLDKHEGYKEHAWQLQILDILRLLHPKYIAVLPKVSIKNSINQGRLELDFLLVDVNGNVDVVEIKRPFPAKIVTGTKYRGNHVPHRELAGTVTQVEKYLFHLKRWGTAGEEALTKRYMAALPADLTINIVNPCGLVIMGRDNDLTPEQKADFEIFRRQNKNLIDVITYDDLLRRLERLLDQLESDI